MEDMRPACPLQLSDIFTLSTAKRAKLVRI